MYIFLLMALLNKTFILFGFLPSLLQNIDAALLLVVVLYVLSLVEITIEEVIYGLSTFYSKDREI